MSGAQAFQQTACETESAVVQCGHEEIQKQLRDAHHVRGHLHAALQVVKRQIESLEEQLNHQGN